MHHFHTVIMGIQVNIHEEKSRLSSLVARAEAGEEVVIARANRPTVRLVPIQKEKPARRSHLPLHHRDPGVSTWNNYLKKHT